MKQRTNTDRANRAAHSVTAYWGTDGDEETTTKARDLATDLCHLFEREGEDPESQLASALGMYREEKAEDPA